MSLKKVERISSFTQSKLYRLSNPPLNLGFQPNLIQAIQKALYYYSQANNDVLVGLSILSVNPLARALHEYAIKRSTQQTFSFKPVYNKTKSLKSTVLACFLGCATDAYLAELNAEYAVEFQPQSRLVPVTRSILHKKPLDSKDEIKQMPSAQVRRSLIKQARTASGIRVAELESSSSEQGVVFHNVEVTFPMVHLLYLYAEEVICLTGFDLDANQLIISFREEKYQDYSSPEKIIAHQQLHNGQARVQLQPDCLQDAAEFVAMLRRIDLQHVLPDQLIGEIGQTRFWQKNSENPVKVFDDHGKALRSLGIRTHKNAEDVLIMSDMDVHLAIFGDGLEHGEVIESVPGGRLNAASDEANTMIQHAFHRLQQCYKNSGNPDFDNFDWASFARQLDLGGNLGYLSVQELVLFGFINHYCGRGNLGPITRIMQHGPTSRYIKQMAKNQLLGGMTRAYPDFPAVNQGATIGVVYSNGELHQASGVEVLAYYHFIQQQGLSVQLNPVWQQQIDLLCDGDEALLEDDSVDFHRFLASMPLSYQASRVFYRRARSGSVLLFDHSRSSRHSQGSSDAVESNELSSGAQSSSEAEDNCCACCYVQ